MRAKANARLNQVTVLPVYLKWASTGLILVVYGTKAYVLCPYLSV